MIPTFLIQLAQHFHLHECLNESDLKRADKNWTAKYIHHFFPDANKLSWTEDFSAHIYYIPTTFDVHVKVCGSISHHDMPETVDEEASHDWVINTLETAQPFPGGFMRNEQAFINRLRSLSPDPQPAKKLRTESREEPIVAEVDPKLRLNLTGTPCARWEHDMEGSTKVLWLIEVAVAGSNEDEHREDSAPGLPRPFGLVHRRIEWLMHYYIDALSGIELDPRWRVFVPIRYLTDLDPLELARREIARLEDSDKKKDVVQLAHKVHSEWPQIKLATINKFMVALNGEPPDSLLESGVAMSAVLEEGRAPIEILGLITVFQFFSLPQDRARLSQFFILPHRQRAGIGRKVLSVVYELLCADPNIREVSVEDPAPAFQRLRDIVALELSIKRGLIRKECLYPMNEVLKAIKAGSKGLQVITDEISPTSSEEWPQYSSVLRKIQKETPVQRRRIKLLLILARALPSDILMSANLEGPVVTPKRGDVITAPVSRKKVTEGGISLVEWQRESHIIKPLRIIEKRRFRLESLEWYDNQRSLSDVQFELDNEWLQLFLSLCGSLRVVRISHPLI